VHIHLAVLHLCKLTLYNVYISQDVYFLAIGIMLFMNYMTSINYCFMHSIINSITA